MTKLEQVQNNYNNKLTELKYEKAVNLLELLSDDDYAQLCDDNVDLISPISGPDGQEYLHNQEILDALINVFTTYIEDAEHNPDKMNLDELKQYIESLIFNLDEERLRGIAKTIKTMLGV